MGNQGFKLTEQQISFFQTFGYLSFPGLMPDRIEEIDREFEAVWSERGGEHNGKPHEETAPSWIASFIDQSEVLSSLLDDQRILAMATTMLGEIFNYMGSDGKFYVGDTRWHSDGQHGPEDPMHIKIAFYLDILTDEQIGNSPECWGLQGRDVPAVIFETQPGMLSFLIITPTMQRSVAGFAGGCSP